MAEETLSHAARRLIRMVRVDDAAHGGLLSRDTIIAADLLETRLEHAERCAREFKENGGTAPVSNGDNL